MTNMMMNGVVAINGGVGVMEIRQPLPQTVESVAQPVENLTVNAHISLRELKNTVAAVIEKKLPKYAQLKANRKIAESLSDSLIEYQKIQKWDGRLPTVSGGNALVSIDPAE